MKKLVSMFAFIATITLGAFTLASCGDDEVTPSTPSQPQGPTSSCKVSVRIDHNANPNPFASTDKDAEDKVIQEVESLMLQALENTEGIVKKYGGYYYEDSKEDQVLSAIRASMDKLEPTIKSKKLDLDGQLVCEVSGDGFKTIWIKAFEYTQSLISFTYKDINYCAINDSEVGVVIKPRNGLGDSAYAGDIEIPETVENDGKTYTVTTIGPKAFYNCGITSIVLPKTLTTLYNGCFCYTKSLTSITLPGKLNSYKESSGYATSSATSPIFDNSAITEAVLEEGITTLCEKMFDGADKLQKVVLPSTVTEIPNQCFSRCQNLSDITVNGVITSIGAQSFYHTAIKDLSVFKFKNASTEKWTFYKCDQLEEINIPEGMASIGTRCFSYCENATSATIPASVTSMAIGIFESCKALKEIHVKGDKPATLEEMTLDSGEYTCTFWKLDFTAQGITIYVPAASVDTYKKAPVWSKYADYIKGE
ncbi:MAG: leucine-rich repeat domain-containing protein [Bacteroidaceae bacterium]|nr:leucine-rich repeat domain-containing protein [Bacteroidaceae bacterium]